MFIAIEGITGAGKTTVAQFLHKSLSDLGYSIHLTKEPFGSPLGKKYREVILSGTLSPEELLELFFLIRNDHEKNIVIPLIEQGSIVISDRFRGAFFAFHVFRQGFDYNILLEELMVRTPFIHPDITVLLDVDPVISLERKCLFGNPSVFDNDTEGNHRERQGYLWLAEQSQFGRWSVIDANQSLDVVKMLCVKTITEASRS